MVKIYTIAFFSGLAVMGIELSASRLIAPYYGSSLFVWTNVIGVILAALALGYYLGGKLSEIKPHVKSLLVILFIAGILTAIVPFIIKPLAYVFAFDPSMFGSVSAVIVIGSFFLTVLLFFIPIMLMGMTSPFLIKIVSHDRIDMGNVSGRIFAISTLGSIVGTFLPALIFIPIFGTKATILIFACVLIVMGSAGFLPKKFYPMILLIFLSFTQVDASLKSSKNMITEAESAYQYVQVQEDEEGIRTLVYNEGGAFQSLYNSNTIWNNGHYYDVISLTPQLVLGGGVAKNVLVVGSAGGTIIRTMDGLFGNSFIITGVEIDKKVIQIARDFFGLDKIGAVIQEADGRNYLQFNNSVYDVVMVDAYSNQMYIPFHLATKEFFKLVQSRLVAGGILTMNVNAPSDNSKILKSISNTLMAVFDNVYAIHVPDTWNYVLLASNEEIDFENLQKANFPGNLNFTNFAPIVADYAEKLDRDPKVRILTDDWAPLENMTDAMIWEAIREQLR